MAKNKTTSQKLEEEMLVDFTRQRDFYDPYKSEHRVTIVGCGGIGSPTAVFLSKLGIPNLTLIDDDLIEPHNLPNQFYPLKMSGREKVMVLKAVCEMFGTSDVQPIVAKVGEVPKTLNGTVVTGLDSMSARKEVWDLVKNNPNVDYLVDGRIGGMEIVIWTIDVHDKEQQTQYEEWALFSDEEGDEAPCTARGIIDVGALVAGLITSQVRKIATKQNTEMLISLSVGDLTLWTTKTNSQTVSQDPEVTVTTSSQTTSSTRR